MGTRSMTIVMEGDKEIVRIYRQYDGYPKGHGMDLAKLCDLKIVNGIGAEKTKIANGMGCLAAQIIHGLKDGPGGVYLHTTGGEIDDWAEFVYIVRGKVGEVPTIDCTTKTGPYPFNMQEKEGLVFSGNAKGWLKKYEEKAA